MIPKMALIRPLICGLKVRFLRGSYPTQSITYHERVALAEGNLRVCTKISNPRNVIASERKPLS